MAPESPSVLLLQHAPLEDEGLLGAVLSDAGLRVRRVLAYAGESIPARLDGERALVVLGGPQSVCTPARHQHLLDEMRLVGRALESRRPVLGICLGSQLLASVLGARVRRAPEPEIGWHPVWATQASLVDDYRDAIPARWRAFHWHSDAFELPPGATSLARSALTECQAFYADGALGLQFHPEVTSAWIDDLLKDPDEAAAWQRQPGDVTATDVHLPASREAGAELFRAWTRTLSRRP